MSKPSGYELIRDLVCGKCGLVCVRHNGGKHPEVMERFRMLEDQNRELQNQLDQATSKLYPVERALKEATSELTELKKMSVVRLDDRRRQSATSGPCGPGDF